MQFPSETTTMDLARGYGAVKNGISIKKFNDNQLKRSELINGAGVGSSPNILSVIKVPDSRALRRMSISLFLALLLLAFALPSIGFIMSDSSPDNAANIVPDVDMNDDGFKLSRLPNLFRDLIEEGLLKKGHRGLVITSGGGLDTLSHNGIEFIILSDSDFIASNEEIPNQAFDFVFVRSFKNAKTIDRVVKIGGVVVSQLSNNPQNELLQPENYRIAYLRRFENTMIAMKKMGAIGVDGLLANKPARRLLCGNAQESKKEALRGLEDAMLEPPMVKASAKRSNNNNAGSRKMKFLPDLLKDSLENYPRRIFISDDGDADGVVQWFNKNYPARNQEFEVYNMEISEPHDQPGNKRSSSGQAEGSVSDWLRNHVRKEDYVVMKAEATVVEELIKEKASCLVDEMFMECKNQWEQDGEEENSGEKRAYWQCLALYGRLRDEGVAVHQWWT